MIASGDLPDVIFTSNEIDRLCDGGLCYSYDELIEQYGVDWEPSAERVAIAKTHNANPEDDHFYTILQNYNTNEEWAKAKGVVPAFPVYITERTYGRNWEALKWKPWKI